jgi:hypothetical protein
MLEYKRLSTDCFSCWRGLAPAGELTRNGTGLSAMEKCVILQKN